MAWRITTGRGLNAADFARVLELQRVCEAADHLDLKLELQREHADGDADTALAWRDGMLAGYCGVDFGREAEVCGMVCPGLRGAGCGGELLRAARDIAAAAGRESVLVICEDAAPDTLSWLRRLGATPAHAELRMHLRLEGRRRNDAAGLRLRKATTADVGRVIAILAEGFGESAADIGIPPLDRTYVAVEGDDIVGTTRIVESRRWMIYGFVVAPRVRGRGVGRRMLEAALDTVAGRGADEVALEVDTENVPAVRLYTGAGFEPLTTYRYMRLATDSRT